MTTQTPTQSLPPAVVMNLMYTGLGIARSLGERGIRVIGLTADRRIYGCYSRYVEPRECADSRHEPEAVFEQLMAVGRELGPGAVLFPTRDHDVVVLDRFRSELERYFRLVIPPRAPLACSLNKWETHLAAAAAGVPTPDTWLVDSEVSLRAAETEIRFPCIMKPLEAHHWRSGQNWQLVGGRKAISVSSVDALREEYATVSRADRRVLIQEQVPGGDDCLLIAACYIDRQGKFAGGFTVQKLLQSPPLYGTGCILQSVQRPELIDRSVRLLEAIGYQGIAEVEYKWDAAAGECKLIEINPRPWDQHRLGGATGVDLMYMAYCDLADVQAPTLRRPFTRAKWIAEDALVMHGLQLLWHRESGLSQVLRDVRGRRVYAIWSFRDPLPGIVHASRLVVSLIGTALRAKKRVSPPSVSVPTTGAAK